MDPVGDLASLASPDPRRRFEAEERLARAGAAGIDALARLLACEEAPEVLRRRAGDLFGTLLREGAVAQFRAAVPDPTAPDLWAGAVAIAAEGHPSLDRAQMDVRLAGIAAEALRSVPAGLPISGRVRGLTEFLANDLGFRGNGEAYDEIENSYLPDVLERRRGIPVTLSVLWIAVAKRIGIEAAGVGLPLHFVVRCETEAGTEYVDAFHGAVLDEAGCRALVAKAAGREVVLPVRAFRPLRAWEVLARMIRNLRAIHERAGNWHGVLADVDRTLWLTPLDAAGWRERALLLARLSRPAAAARAIARALALEPGAKDREALEGLKGRLKREAAALN